jgi:3-deoxy-7-phosphoheptulonate synthase
MIVVMEPDATDQAVENVISFLVSAGFDVHRSSGHSTTILGVVGDLTGNDVSVVSEFPGVSQVVRVSEQFRLSSRRFRQRSTVIEGPWGSIGGDKPWIAIEAVGPGANTRRPDEPSKVDSDVPPASRELTY